MTSLIAYLPFIYLTIQVLFDTSQLWSHSRFSLRQAPGALALAGFLFYLAILFQLGINAAISLLSARLPLSTSSIIGSITVGFAYHLIKNLVSTHPRAFELDLKSLKNPNVQIFLHYFAYTTFSAGFFVILTFIFLAIF